MNQALSRVDRIPRLGRLGWLMGLYAENYQHLMRLFAPDRLHPGRYASSIGDGLDLYLDVIECHRYTVELRMTYGILDPLTDPLTEGEVGDSGRVAITGSGFAPTHLVVKIRGGLSEGVRIHCIETGEAVEFHRQINHDETMVFDFDDERVLFQNQSDLSMFLTGENWFRPSGDATIQFTPLGVQSGEPTMTVEWKEAWR